MKKETPCINCVRKPCENNPYNPDGECWLPNTLLESVASGSVQVVEVILDKKTTPKATE